MRLQCLKNWFHASSLRIICICIKLNVACRKSHVQIQLDVYLKRQRDGIYRARIICRNPWSQGSLAHFISFTMFWFFSKHTTSKHSTNADGFGVCFEMGKKGSKMCSLYIPSLCKKVVITIFDAVFVQLVVHLCKDNFQNWQILLETIWSMHLRQLLSTCSD